MLWSSTALIPQRSWQLLLGQETSECSPVEQTYGNAMNEETLCTSQAFCPHKGPIIRSFDVSLLLVASDLRRCNAPKLLIQDYSGLSQGPVSKEFWLTQLLAGHEDKRQSIASATTMKCSPCWDFCLGFVKGHGPLIRYAKLRVAPAPGMLGTFFPPPTSKETDS